MSVPAQGISIGKRIADIIGVTNTTNIVLAFPVDGLVTATITRNITPTEAEQIISVVEQYDFMKHDSSDEVAA